MVPVRELLSALVSPVIVVFTLLIALKTFAIRPLQDQLTAMQTQVTAQLTALQAQLTAQQAQLTAQQQALQAQLTAQQLSLQHIDQQLVPRVSELQGRVDVLQQTGNTLLSK